MSKFVRYCITENNISGPNVFDVSRNSILGNPFTHIKDKKTRAIYVVESRDEAIDLYGKYFDGMYKRNKAFKAFVDEMYDASKKYDVIYIGCYCKENERCHGDIIIEKLNNMAIVEALKNIKNKIK